VITVDCQQTLGHMQPFPSLCYPDSASQFPAIIILTEGFFWISFFSMYFIQHRFICRPSDSTVSEDAGIEPRTVATVALAVRHFNH
jgi:hypothetical protein